MSNRSQDVAEKGFTLVELMIVIVIISILATVAYPSYQGSVRRSRRAVAQADLMAFANAMERRFSVRNDYLQAADGSESPDTGPPALTTFSTTSPTAGGEIYYNLRIQNANQLQYTLQAVPVNAQAGDGILTINQAGVRTWKGQPGWDQ